MKSRNWTQLVDSKGHPFSDRIQAALFSLHPRFRRVYPSIRDEAVVSGLFEEVAERIVEREQCSGPLQRLHGFAWTALRNLAASRLRKSESKIECASVDPACGEWLLSGMPSARGTKTEIEFCVLMRELLAELTPRERKVALLKQAEFTSEEIAERLGVTCASVDQMYFRVRNKLRKVLTDSCGDRRG